MRKYILTGETRTLHQHTLHRIRATKSFMNGAHQIREGDLGGWVANEQCLSQNDLAWVGDEAVCMGAVLDNALLIDHATLHKGGIMIDRAVAKGSSDVYGHMTDDSIIQGKATLKGSAMHSARISNNATVGEGVEARSGMVISRDAIKYQPVFMDGIYFPYLPVSHDKHSPARRTPVTITDEYVRIGCRERKITDSMDMSDAELLQYHDSRTQDVDLVQAFRTYEPILKSLLSVVRQDVFNSSQ